MTASSEFFDTLERVIGERPARRVIAQFGGARFYFPRADKVREDSELAKCIGYDAAVQLCDELVGKGSGYAVVVPMMASDRRLRRDRLIVRMSRRGMSTTMMAQRLRLHERTIWRRLKVLKRMGLLK